MNQVRVAILAGLILLGLLLNIYLWRLTIARIRYQALFLNRYQWNMTRMRHQHIKTDFQINQDPCPAGTRLIVLVQSDPERFEMRQIVRDTWAGSFKKKSTRLYFVLGAVEDEAIQIKIVVENEYMADLIQGFFLDTPENQTYKHVLGLNWATNYCKSARFLLKTDDDGFVSGRTLEKFLFGNESSAVVPNKTDLVMCKILSTNTVSSESSPDLVKFDKYPKSLNPEHCSGFYIIYSMKTAKRLFNATKGSIFIGIENAQVVGYLAQKLNVTLTEMPADLRKDRKEITMLLSDNSTGLRFLFCTTHLDYNEIHRMWLAHSNHYRKINTKT